MTESECETLVDTIKEVNASGVSIIWIEHIVHVPLAVVSRLIVINFGRLMRKAPRQRLWPTARSRRSIWRSTLNDPSGDAAARRLLW